MVDRCRIAPFRKTTPNDFRSWHSTRSAKKVISVFDRPYQNGFFSQSILLVVIRYKTDDCSERNSSMLFIERALNTLNECIFTGPNCVKRFGITHNYTVYADNYLKLIIYFYSWVFVSRTLTLTSSKSASESKAPRTHWPSFVSFWINFDFQRAIGTIINYFQLPCLSRYYLLSL